MSDESISYDEHLLVLCLEELVIQGAPSILVGATRRVVEMGFMEPTHYVQEDGSETYGFRLTKRGMTQIERHKSTGIGEAMLQAQATLMTHGNNCPGHVARDDDPKVCRHCGIHINEERPDEPEDPEELD